MSGRVRGGPAILAFLVLFGAILLSACTAQSADTAVTPDPNDPLAPPRGALETTKSLDGSGFAGNQRVYRTPATTDEVLAFYQKELPNRGWTLLPDRSTPKDGQLTFQGSDGKTILGIRVEESARQRRVTVGVIVRP